MEKADCGAGDLRNSGIAVTALATGGSHIFGPNHAWAMATTDLDPRAARTGADIWRSARGRGGILV
jgi:hypothetical protein